MSDAHQIFNLECENKVWEIFPNSVCKDSPCFRLWRLTVSLTQCVHHRPNRPHRHKGRGLKSSRSSTVTGCAPGRSQSPLVPRGRSRPVHQGQITLGRERFLRYVLCYVLHYVRFYVACTWQSDLKGSLCWLPVYVFVCVRRSFGCHTLLSKLPGRWLIIKYNNYPVNACGASKIEAWQADRWTDEDIMIPIWCFDSLMPQKKTQINPKI